MPKNKVEEIFDKYAKGYASNDFAPVRYDTSRAAMSLLTVFVFLPLSRSIR